MANAKNPRRTVLLVLREMKRNINQVVTIWNQPQTRFDPDIPSPDPNGQPGGWRKLFPSERRENQTEQWARLAESMDAIIAQATDIRDYAHQQLHTTPNPR